MTKPILQVSVLTLNKKKRTVQALFDTDSYYTILREDCVPKGGIVYRYKTIEHLQTAGKKGGINITGESILIISIGGKQIRSSAYITPDIRREMIIGAEVMQSWDITIRNRNGRTRVIVGRDMRDPELTEVD